MGFISRVKATYPAHHDYWYRTPEGWLLSNPTASGQRVDADRAMGISAFSRCVRLISGIVALLPLKMYRHREDEGKDLARYNPLYPVLHSRPNARQTSLEFRDQLTGDLLLGGNAYAEIVPGPRGAVDQLIPLLPNRMRPAELSSGRIQYEYHQPGVAKPKIYLQDEIFHLRSFSRDGIVGISPVERHRELIGLALSEEEYGARMFSNGAQLGGILSHPKNLTEPAQQRLEKQFSDDYTGTRKSFKTIVLEEDMKWTQVSMRARDAQYLESRKFQIAEIARIFGVPLHMLAEEQKDSSWGSGIESQWIGFLSQTIQYWLTLWEQAISRDLVIAPDLYFPQFTVEGLLRGDIATRMAAYATGIQHGIYSPNEVRAKENMNPRAGGEEFWRPLNMGGGSDQSQSDNITRLKSGQAISPGRAVGLLPAVDSRLERMVRNAADRLASKETSAVKKAAARLSGNAFAEWADEFYIGLGADISESLQVSFDAAENFVLAAKVELLADDDIAGVVDRWQSTRVEELTDLALGMQEAA